MAVQSIKQECDQVWSLKEESLAALNPSMVKSEMLDQGPAVTDVDVKEEPIFWDDSVAGSSICGENHEHCWSEEGQTQVFASEQQKVCVKDKEEKFSPRNLGVRKCEENLMQNIVRPEFVNADKEPWDLVPGELVGVDPFGGYGHNCTSSLTLRSPEYSTTHQIFFCDTKEGLFHIEKSEEAPGGASVFEEPMSRQGTRVGPQHEGPSLRGATGELCSSEQGKEPSVVGRELPLSDEEAAEEERISGEVCVKRDFGDLVTADSVKCIELSGIGNKMTPGSEKTYECDECGTNFSLKCHLIKHLKSHMGMKCFLCTFCGARFGAKSHLIRHIRTHAGQKPYVCNLCEARFSRKTNLNRHTKIHTGEKPHECTLCGSRFLEKRDLKRHLQTHSGEKPYICNLCEARFSQKHKLRDHTRTHTGEKPYACNFCEVKFSHKSSLNAHTRIHTGEKPHACTLCDLSFSQKKYLTTHLRSHTGEKPYSCTLCDARFIHSNVLNRHLRLHSGEKPYTCNLCEARFTQKGDLKVHTRIHTGEKPYACTLCEARFLRKSHLNVHTKIHTGEKLHACTLCGSRFSQKRGLKRHLPTHW